MTVLKQRVRKTQNNLQCLYDLDRRVFCVKTYPVLSPQGANIVIYGHENGISVVWRGGRPFKDTKKPDPKPAPTSDSVMIIDSDDDDGTPASASSAAFVDKPVFESAPADTNAGGFSEIVQTLDLALNQAVLSIAVLPLAPCAAKDAEPSLLQEQMVFAVTCRATTDVYVVTLPLTPPSKESKARPQLRTDLIAGSLGQGAFGETLTQLGGQNRRSEGVAIALAKQKNTSIAGGPGGSGGSGSGAKTASSLARLIVAAHSCEASGTLRLWDVTVGAKRGTLSERSIEPFQTEYLPSPLKGLAFNPTHPTQLLVVDPQRAVRIYDYTIPAIPSDESAEGPFSPQGSWLLSLYPPFARGGGATTAARKPIVAAAWIAHGHAILALLADGQWGVWDIDKTSTSSSGSSNGGVFGAGSAVSGVRGAALTSFTISGQIEGTTPLRNPVAASRKSTEGDFVPMTPHTRRDALAASFAGGVERLVATPGGIEVVQQRSLRGSTIGKETAVLWLGGADYIVAVIPDVARFWDSQLRRVSGGGGNLFHGARPTRMLRVQDLNASLQGERCCGATIVPYFPRQAQHTGGQRSTGVDDEGEDEDGFDAKDEQVEVLVQGESRLVAVRESSEQDPLSGGFTTRLLAASARKRNVGAGGVGNTVTSAILVEPRTRKPGTVKFDLDSLQRQSADLRDGQSNNNTNSLHRQLALGATTGTPRRAPLTKSLFESPSRPTASSSSFLTPRRQRSLFDENEVTLTQSMMRPQQQRRQTPDFAFGAELEDAANASDDDEAVQERNIEEEMLNIMEIDRELEAMDGRRDGGSGSNTGRNIFFENA